MYWHVDDLEAAVARSPAMGARAHEEITERGEAFVTASVIDPSGNIVGVMSNPTTRRSWPVRVRCRRTGAGGGR